MQHRMVDLAIVGTDRVTANGDVCNKIGTYLKALAAHDNGVPFYVALPSPTIDFSIDDGIRQIPIEQRSADEVATMTGRTADGRVENRAGGSRRLACGQLRLRVTPARLVTGLITERGLLGRSVLHLRAHSRSAARDIDAGDVGTYPRSGLSYRGSPSPCPIPTSKSSSRIRPHRRPIRLR
jgi:methylthioribose-1-phosphate isomerase